MTKFLKNISVESAGHVQFKTTDGTSAGKIEQDGNNLVLSNAVGDVLLGDGASDVYIGDGVNNVDILFEQSGSIKGDGSAVTLTLGGSNTTLNLENPNINGNLSIGLTSISNKLTFTGNDGYILFDREPSNYDGTTSIPLLKVDQSGTEKTILERVSANGGILLGADDTIMIAGGDTRAVLRTNINETGESVVIASESGFTAYGFPGNDTSWANRNEFRFRSDSSTASENGLYIGDGGSAQLVDLSRNLTANTLTTSGNIKAMSGGNIYVYDDNDDTKIHVNASSNSTEGVFRVSNGSNYGLIVRGISNNPRLGAYQNGTLDIYGFGNSDGANHADDDLLARFDFANERFDVNGAIRGDSLDIDGNADISGNLVIAGTVDGVDISALPTTFAPTNAEQNVQSDWNATSGDALILNKPTIPAAITDYVSAANGGTFSGALKITDAINTGSPILDLHNSTNGESVDIRFTDVGAGTTQFGNITYRHQDSKSYGSAAGFIIGSEEATTTILADGKLMYNEGIYSKPATGTGAGTRKDSNWDAAYTHSTSTHAPTNAEQNVQSDWNATSGDALILNKPTIPAAITDYVSKANGGTFSGPLNITSLDDTKLVLRVPSGDTNDWNYINFTGANGTRDAYFGTTDNGTPSWYRDDGATQLRLDSDKVYANKKLQVNGELEATSLDINGNADISGTARIHSRLTFGGNVNNFIEGTGSSLDFKSNGDYFFRKGANTQLTILSNSNVGIGTTSPDSPLHIEKTDTNYDVARGIHVDYTKNHTNTTGWGASLFGVRSNVYNDGVGKLTDLQAGRFVSEHIGTGISYYLLGSQSKGVHNGSGNTGVIWGAFNAGQVLGTGTGTHPYLIGTNQRAELDNPNASVALMQSIVAYTKTNAGTITNRIVGAEIGLDCNQGSATTVDAAVLYLAADVGNLTVSGNARTINSVSTLPSVFAGSIQAPQFNIVSEDNYLATDVDDLVHLYGDSGIKLESGEGASLEISDEFSFDAGVVVAGSTEATSFIKTGGTSSQFLKADGSVDSTTYLSSLPSHTHTFASLTSKPTTLSGYGITDAATSTQGSNADTAFGWGDHGLSAQDKTDIGNLSGTNTGDQDLSGYLLNTSDTLTGSLSIANSNFTGLSLTRNSSNGSSIDFNNSTGLLGRTGFLSNGTYAITNGGAGTSNMLAITSAGNISATNLSGTNTGDQDLSGYVTTNTTQTISGFKTINNDFALNYTDLLDVATGYFTQISIGATSPTSELHIATASPEIKIEDTSNLNANIILDGTRRTDITQAGTKFTISDQVFGESFFEYDAGSSMNIKIGDTNFANETHIEIDDNTARVLIPNGSVGIGTTAPSEELHVAGRAIVEDRLAIGGDFVPQKALHLKNAAPVFRFEDSDITGGYLDMIKTSRNMKFDLEPTDAVSSTNFDFKIGGTTHLYMKNSQVGIMNDSPTEALDITGNVQAETLIATDLTDGYVPYSKSGTLGLQDSKIYTQGAAIAVGTTTLAAGCHITSLSDISATGYRVSAMQTAPATRNSTGTLGEIRITSNYIYVCYATNSWSRVALATSW